MGKEGRCFGFDGAPNDASRVRLEMRDEMCSLVLRYLHLGSEPTPRADTGGMCLTCRRMAS